MLFDLGGAVANGGNATGKLPPSRRAGKAVSPVRETATATADAVPVVNVKEDALPPSDVGIASLDADVLAEWPAPPCSSCGSLELWEDVYGDWHCRHCEPFLVNPRLVEVARRIRRQYPEIAQAATAGTVLPDAVCPCGSLTWRDVPIHDGKAVRRDCDRCGRFLDFPVWDGSVFPHSNGGVS